MKTRVLINKPEQVLIEPAYCMEKNFEEINIEEISPTMHIIPHYGITLKAVEDKNISNILESFNLQKDVKSVDYSLEEGKSDKLFFQYLGEEDQEAEGDFREDVEKVPYLKKSGEHDIYIRSMISKKRYSFDSCFELKWFFPVSPFADIKEYLCLLIPGPKRIYENVLGEGVFKLSVSTKGIITIYELTCSDDEQNKKWEKRYSFKIPKYSGNLDYHHLRIYFKKNIIKNSNKVGHFVFKYELHTSDHESSVCQNDSIFTYDIYDDSGQEEIFSHTEHLRVDVNKKYTPIFYAGIVTLEDLGSFKESGVVLPFIPTTDTPIVLEWYGRNLENGRISSEISFEEDSGKEILLEPLDVGDGYARYPVQKCLGKYVATLRIDRNRSDYPVVESIKISREGVVETKNNEVLLLEQVREVNIFENEENISRAAIVQGLMKSSNDQSFSSYPISIEQVYDDGSSLQIFRGYVSEIQREYISNELIKYTIYANDMHQRLREQFIPVKFNWCYDRSTLDENRRMTSFKVTDMIKYLLLWCGFSESEIDIADSENRLSVESEKQLIMNPHLDICKYIKKISRDHLSGMVVFQPELGENGKWVLKKFVKPEKSSVFGKFYSGVPPSNVPISGHIKRTIGRLKKTEKAPRSSQICIYGLIGSIQDKNSSRFSYILNERPDRKKATLRRFATYPIFESALRDDKDIKVLADFYRDKYCYSQIEFSFTTLDAQNDIHPDRILMPGDIVLVQDELCIINFIRIFYNKDELPFYDISCKQIASL